MKTSKILYILSLIFLALIVLVNFVKPLKAFTGALSLMAVGCIGVAQLMVEEDCDGCGCGMPGEM